MTWSTAIFDGSDASSDLVEWASAKPSLKVAWSECDRVAWLYWLAARLTRSSEERLHVVRSALFVLTRGRSTGFAWPPWRSMIDAATAWAYESDSRLARGRLGPTRALLWSFAGASVVGSTAALTTGRWSIGGPAFAIALVILAAQVAKSDRAFVRRSHSELDFATVSNAILSALQRCDEQTRSDRRRLLADTYRDIVSQPGWLRLV